MNQNRRTFIKQGAAASTALLLASFESLAAANPPSPSNPASELKILATNWGFKGTLDEYGARVKQEGYDGIEIWWPMEAPAQAELFSMLKKWGLQVGFLCGGSQKDFKEHFSYFQKMIDAAANNTIQKPLYINCHSGRDFFSYEENSRFIEHTTQLGKQTGIPISHETHRSRMLFAAPVAKQYIQKYPELRVTLDISHWCNVSESLLADQPENVDLALERVLHIHARIGHPEGPQVSDPRAPEWEAAVKAHLAWWDKVVERKKKTGERITFLTEFGPPDYMPTLPYTRQPLADQWAVNVFMMQLLRKRYAV
ncbi:MAG: sugar phosphate isomerase/epimerase [Williamsia sp.]|nr:sugar phosphate isomerase/epimerase [Williamsia sp.]